jgi:hypothetical protein
MPATPFLASPLGLCVLVGRSFPACYSPASDLLFQPLARFSPVSYLGQSFVGWALWQRLLLIVLVTPIFVGGQITDEKQRGILQFTFLTEIEASQLVLAKLLAQGLLLTSLLLVDLPLLMLATAFEAVSPGVVLAHTAAMVVLLFAVGAASLLASVWSRTTRSVMLSIGLVVVFVGAGTWLFHELLAVAAASSGAGPWQGCLDLLDAGLELAHPLYLVDVKEGPGQLAELMRRMAIFTLFWGFAAVVLTGLAGRFLRRVYLRQLENAGAEATKESRRGSRRPAIGDDPVYWKERWVEGAAPAGFLRSFPRFLTLILIAAASIALTWWELEQAPYFPSLQLLIHPVLACCVFGLFAGLRSCTAMVVEKQRHTFEPLMLTDWTYGQCIVSMYRGVVVAYLPALWCYTLAPVVTAAFLNWNDFELNIVLVPLVWQTVMWVTLCGFESSRAESRLLPSLLCTAVLAPLVMGIVVQAWVFVGMALELWRRPGSPLDDVPFKQFLLGACLAFCSLVAVVAPYLAVSWYYQSLEWKAHRPTRR